jgi:SAM-dependent methyltransferase
MTGTQYYRYHEVRLPYDTRRTIVWDALWKFYFSKQIRPDDCVLDLGCGYGDFINAVVARRRIAIDSWPDFPHHLSAGVEAIVGSVTDLGQLADSEVDFALASNLLEHLSLSDAREMLRRLHRKLRPGGTLTIVQPNWRYAYREYFDDYTHISIWSHISMSDFLTASGWEVLEIIPRFLPLTVKSRFPISPWLIRAWLLSPVKPMGKQMLIRARPRALI